MRYGSCSAPFLVGLGLVLAASGVCGCTDDPHGLDWVLVYSEPGMSTRTRLVEARILESGCTSSDAVYTTRFAQGAVPDCPPELGRGVYGFSARALDDACHWYAAGCVEKRLPLSGERVEVTLSPPPGEPARCTDCGTSLCSIADAGTGTDAPVEDAGIVVAPPAVPVTIRREAESADPLTAPMVAQDDEKASGGRFVTNPYVEQPDASLGSFKRNEAPADEAGLATYSLEITEPGGYRMWARVIMPTLDEDSFWLRMDDGAWILWNDVSHGENWTWVDVRDFPTRQRELYFDLTAGTHTLTVGYRELNAKLDAFLLTNDPTFVPED